MSSTPAPALILSPTPPAPETRAFYETRFGVATSFADLPGLRREGLGAAFKRLRVTRVATVVVSGPADELRLFEDYLLVLSFLVPGARRERQAIGEEPSALKAWHLGRSLVRIAAGLVAGAYSLTAARRRVGRLAKEHFAPRRLEASARCLYLKPLLSFGANVGGSVAHVAGVANAMARSGTAVRLLTAVDQPLVDSSVAQRIVPADILVSFPFEVNQHRYQRLFLRAARDAAKEVRPDFVYQRYALNDTTGVLVARSLRVPLVLEFNGSEVWAQRHWGQALRFERLAQAIESANLRHADLVVVVSQALVEQAVSLGAAPERVLFYPNGIDPRIFDPGHFDAADRRALRRELSIPVDATLLTFVGTFGRWHGTDVLAAAIRRLVDRDRDWLERYRAHFLYVGDGALAPAVREILGPDLAAPFVTLAGLRPQSLTPRILAASDILLSPHVPNTDGSPFFGSPTKLFEYMAMAKPIVASDLDQIGWVLKGWRPGEVPPASGAPGRSLAAVLVEPGNLESLVAGIRRVVEMPGSEREALGREARRLVFESFTWEKNVEAVFARLRAREEPAPA